MQENTKAGAAALPPAERPQAIIKTIKLSARGPKLPLGTVEPGGGVGNLIEVRPWRLKEERELAELHEKEGEGANMASFVAMTLAAMCTMLGGARWTALKEVERRALISTMWMGDVLYAYAWLRYQAMGKEIKFNVQCPQCRSKYPFTADLGSLEVSVVEKFEDALYSYKLRDPIKVRGDKLVTGFVLGPARWSVMEMIRPGTGMNVGMAKLRTIQGSIHDVIGREGQPISDEELDELSKYDLEALSGVIDANHIGPNMAIEDKCNVCARPFRASIDWNYEGFFGSSSR